jgi:hypothetical protein
LLVRLLHEWAEKWGGKERRGGSSGGRGRERERESGAEPKRKRKEKREKGGGEEPDIHH